MQKMSQKTTQEILNTMEDKMENQEPIEQDWRTDITEPTATLKLKDGDIVIGTFEDEGVKKSHSEYGDSVAFQFLQDNEKEPRTFYVKANNFSLLAQIKALGSLKGLKVKLSRIGSRRLDTRYKVIKA